MDDYLAKPITLVELRHKLEKWLPHGDPGAVTHSAAVTPRLRQPARAAGGTGRPGGLRQAARSAGRLAAARVMPYLEDTPCARRTGAGCARRHAHRNRAHALKGAPATSAPRRWRNWRCRRSNSPPPASRSASTAAAPLNEQYRRWPPSCARLDSTDATTCTSSDDTPQVLVVDDDRSTRSTLRHTLQRDGFRVEKPPTASRRWPCWRASSRT
jgi:hypothetical protein